MYWCRHCEEYVEPDYSMTYVPLGVGRCPRCHLTVSGNHERPIHDYQNVGNWNVSNFKFVIGAAHSPDFDALMVRLRELEHNGAPETERQAARNKAKAYLLAHRNLLIIEGR